MKDPYPIHGPRRRWYAPWRHGCRCGLDARPCPVERMLGSGKGLTIRVQDVDELGHVRRSYLWSGGAR